METDIGGMICIEGYNKECSEICPFENLSHRTNPSLNATRLHGIIRLYFIASFNLGQDFLHLVFSEEDQAVPPKQDVNAKLPRHKALSGMDLN